MARVARSGRYCGACRSSFRTSGEHYSSQKHRDATRTRDAAVVASVQEEKQRAVFAGLRPDYGSREANDAARARLSPLYGVVIVEDDPTAPDAWDADEPWPDEPIAVEAPPATVSRKRAERTAPLPSPTVAAPTTIASPTLAPCPRCGRADWRTPVGREWHLDNNPACATYRKPERHQYAA